MTPTERDDLRRLAGSATAGPWSIDRAGTNVAPFNVVSPHGEAELGTYSVARGIWWEANAAFIAAANPQTVLALLDEIDALRKERDEALSRAAPSGSDMVPWQAPEEATRDGTPIDAIISYNAAPVTIRWGVIDAIAGWVDVTQGYWAIGEDTELLAWRPAAPPATQPQGADNGK